MLTYPISGRPELQLSHLILDLNGTIALDGAVIEGIRPRLEALAKELSIWVVTADTHGTAAKACKDLPVTVLTFPTENVGAIKARHAMSLQGGVACIGNGYNDIEMAKVCALSVCVLGKEGCCGKLLAVSDIVVTSIEDGLDLLLKPHRLRATLRT